MQGNWVPILPSVAIYVHSPPDDSGRSQTPRIDFSPALPTLPASFQRTHQSDTRLRNVCSNDRRIIRACYEASHDFQRLEPPVRGSSPSVRGRAVLKEYVFAFPGREMRLLGR